MSLIVNDVEIDEVICNGVNVEKVICNGVVVWEAIQEIVSGGSFSDDIGFQFYYNYCNYGPSDSGSWTVNGTTLSVSISDYYQASRYLQVQWILNNFTVVGKGQTVTVDFTYTNLQVQSSSENDHSANKATMYYCRPNGANPAGGVSLRSAIGVGSTTGTASLTLPDDGVTYSLMFELQTWAGLSYSTNTSTLTINNLTIK